MKRALFVLFSLTLGTTSLAQSVNGTIPVQDGTAVKVEKVRIVNREIMVPQDPRHPRMYVADLIASVTYEGGCAAPVALVVVHENSDSGLNYDIVEAHSRMNSNGQNAVCNAITLEKADVKVATFYEVSPNPAMVKVNGVGITQ
jgi:hypothetical protein